MQQVVLEVSSVIVSVLWRAEVSAYFPDTTDDYLQCVNAMNEEWQFPYGFAAIDGSHVRLKCPNGGEQMRKSYFNFKSFYSIIIMALVDAKSRFIWSSVGAPGNTHDSMNFQSTRLYRKICDGTVIPDRVQLCGEVEIPPLILGIPDMDKEAIW